MVREELSLRTGIKVIFVNQILRSREYPFMLANVDGVCRCPTHGKCIFEAKTANAFKAREWEGDSIPQEYILQIQGYGKIACGFRLSGEIVPVMFSGALNGEIFVQYIKQFVNLLNVVFMLFA